MHDRYLCWPRSSPHTFSFLESRFAESEVFGWSWIPNNTTSRIFCLTLDVQFVHFLHHTPNLGIPVEMVQFLLNLLLKQIFLAVHLEFH